MAADPTDVLGTDGGRTGTPGSWPPEPGDAAGRGHLGSNYQLLEQVGVGGMGVVYRAEQLQPVRRTVAVKLIKLGTDTPQVVARFESERQALAVLEHPGIARVYDAGTTDTGRPYFVMEFVAGRPITEYCDTKRLTTNDRLELFMQVCHAVQHAHYKGILHRDLKPSNILVAELDGKALPKVIDFGVAKATQAAPAGDALMTSVGQVIGTPVYMSPEQATGTEVDTRADVYSLGMVLYELLAGALPFDVSDTTSPAGSGQILRQIVDVDPPRPSTRVRSADLHGGVDQPTLSRQLRGDLDRIVMKALEKDPARRYGMAAALAEDLRRHLAHEPITARPPTLAYQARKFARRNRIFVTASAMALAAIVGGSIAATVGMIRARQALARETQARQAEQAQRQVAQNVSQFLSDMLASANPNQAQGKTVLVRDVLDRAAADLPRRFQGQPLTAAALHAVVANTYYALGLSEPARQHWQSALDLRLKELGPDHSETLDAQLSFATSLRTLGRPADAEALLRDNLVRRRKLSGMDAVATVNVEEGLAMALLDRGQAAEAEPLQRHTVEVRRKALGNDHEQTLLAVHNLAPIVEERGHPDEALSLYRAAAEGRQRTLGESHPSTILSLNNLATCMLRQKQFAEAEPILRDVLARSERVLGLEHERTLAAMNNLASVLRLTGRLGEAESAFRDLLARVRRSMPENHPRTLIVAGALAMTLEQEGKTEDAVAQYKDLYERTLVANVPPAQAAKYMSGYGLYLVKLERYAQAEAPLVEGKRRLELAKSTSGSSMREVLAGLAQVYENTGRGEEASRARAAAARLRPATSTMSASQPSA